MVIAIGHKARNGKDSLAIALADKLKRNYEIVHFADALKTEVSNYNNSLPLILQRKVGQTYYYLLFSSGKYDVHTSEEIPNLHNLFLKRKITEYQGSDVKDSEMLQIWGTDFRRNFYGKNYWIERVANKLSQNKDKDKIFIIADCRFKDEHEFVKRLQGKYIDIVRVTPDGSQYLDPDRDPKHESETSLDDVKPDLEIKIKDGDMGRFEVEADLIIKTFKLK